MDEATLQERSTVYPDAAVDTVNETLLDWVRANGGSTGALVIRHSAGIRGLHLEDAVASGGEVLYVPRRLAITADVARSSSIGQRIAAGGRDVSERAYIAAFLLSTSGKSGFWKPYIDILENGPFTHPLFSFIENKAFLHKWFYTSSCVIAFNDECEREFASITEALGAADRFTIQEFTWAFCCVMSRAFTIKAGDRKTIALMPLLDLMNHSFSENCTYKFEEDGCRISAVRTIGADEACSINYGNIGNQQLYPTYGFRIDGNPYNSAYIYFPSDRKLFLCPIDHDFPAVREMFSFLREKHVSSHATSDRGGGPSDPIGRDVGLASLKDLLLVCRWNIRSRDAVFGQENSSTNAMRSPDFHRLISAYRDEMQVVEHYVKLATLAIELLQDLPEDPDCREQLSRLDPKYSAFLRDAGFATFHPGLASEDNGADRDG